VTGKTMMTERYKLPLVALQLTSIRRSDRIPRNRGIIIIIIINSNDRIAATMYSLRTWFVWGMYV
jgi:hypothetical protein